MEVQLPMLVVLLALGKVQQAGGVDPLGMPALVLAAFALFVSGHAIAVASSRSTLLWRLGQPLFGVVAVALIALLAWSAPPAVTLIDLPAALLDATVIVWLGLRVQSFRRHRQAGIEAAQEWVMQTLRIGLIAFAAALVLAIIFAVPQAISGIILLPVYLLGGIVAGAVLRSIALQRVASQADQPLEQHPWTWLAGGIGVVCALAFFGGEMIVPQAFDGVVTPVFQALATGAQWLGNGIGAVFSWLGSVIDQLFSSGGSSTSTSTTSAPTTTPNTGTIAGFPTWFVALSVLLWVVFIGWLIRSWWRSRRPPTARRQIRVPRVLVVVLLAILLILLLSPLFLSLYGATSSLPPTSTTPHGATSPHFPIIWLLVMIGLVICALLVWLLWRSQPEQEATPLRFRLNLLAALRQLLARLRWRRVRSRVAFEQRYSVAGEQRDVMPLPVEVAATLVEGDDDVIRAAYRRMLASAARAGGAWARRPDETPAEYARRLHTLLAAQPDDPKRAEEADAALDTLTDAYRQARYGGQATDTTTRATIAGRLAHLLGVFRR